MNHKQEGDIFKIIELCGKRFVIKYGFYEEFERESKFGEVIPIYPEFHSNPVYNNEGFPFVTQMQDACEYAKIQKKIDACCADCSYFRQGEDLIGFCSCEKRRSGTSPPLTAKPPHSIRSEDSL